MMTRVRRVGAAARHHSPPGGTATAWWVSTDWAGVGTTWTDRIGGRVFTLTNAEWNPWSEAIDLRTDAYATTPDHADLDFAGGQDFTIAVACESLTPGQTTRTILAKKASYNTADIGWGLRMSTTGNLQFVGSDGTTQFLPNVQAMPLGAATVGARMTSDSVQTFVDAVTSAAQSYATVGSLANGEVMRLGSHSGGTPATFPDLRVWSVSIFREALA